MTNKQIKELAKLLLQGINIINAVCPNCNSIFPMVDEENVDDENSIEDNCPECGTLVYCLIRISDDDII